MKKVLFLLLIIFYCSNLFSQEIAGKTDKKQYMIGDPIEYSFSIPKTDKQLTISSDYKFSDTIELIASKIDTNKNEIKYHYTLASFVEGNHNLPNFQFYENTKTIPTYTIIAPNIEVIMPQIDTTNVEVKPLKNIMKVPITIKETLPFGFGVILLVAIIFLIIYLIKNKNKRPNILQKKPEEVIPEDIEALNNISRLKNAHLIENNQVKQHYVALSEILWQYIYRRFNISAFEMTSSQITDSLQDKVSMEEKNKIGNIFSVSDLVKFAKYVPDIRTNMEILDNSISFITNTKREPIAEKQETEENKEAKNA